MSTESVISTTTDVKFIESVTKMTQANWQAYFGTVLPNGVYKDSPYNGFMLQTASSGGPWGINAGTAIANGIVANVATQTTFSASVSDSDIDRFICLRIYFGEEKAQIIAKTGIAASIADADIVAEFDKFVVSEAYNCTRNDDYYEIPLFYQGPDSGHYHWGFDLRRIIEKQWNLDINQDIYDASFGSTYALQICSNHKCSFILGQNYNEYICYLDPINIPDGAAIRVMGGLAQKTFSFSSFPWSYQLSHYGSSHLDFSTVPKTKFVLSTSSNDWVAATGPDRIQMTIPATEKRMFIIHYISNGMYAAEMYQRFVYIEEVPA